MEEEPIPTRTFLRNGIHGSSPPEEVPEELGEIADETRHAEDEPAPTSSLSPGEGATILLNSLSSMVADVCASGADGEGGDSWIDEMNETTSERHQRYVQSAQCEVSDPEEWADIHYGPATSVSRRSRSRRSRSREATPVPTPRTMPKPLCEAMVWQAEEESERCGTTLSSSSTSGSKGAKGAKRKSSSSTRSCCELCDGFLGRCQLLRCWSCSPRRSSI